MLVRNPESELCAVFVCNFIFHFFFHGQLVQNFGSDQV